MWKQWLERMLLKTLTIVAGIYTNERYRSSNGLILATDKGVVKPELNCSENKPCGEVSSCLEWYRVKVLHMLRGCEFYVRGSSFVVGNKH